MTFKKIFYQTPCLTYYTPNYNLNFKNNIFSPTLGPCNAKVNEEEKDPKDNNSNKPKDNNSDNKSRRFPQPSIRGRYSSITFGVPTNASTGMHIFFSDPHREINISVAKYKALNNEIRNAYMNKKKGFSFLITDRYAIPNDRDKRYITKYGIVKFGESMDADQSRVLLVQSYHVLSPKDRDQYDEITAFGVGIPIPDFLKIDESIHQTKTNVSSFENDEPEDLDF